MQASTSVRTFGTGATRNTDTDKLDYEGFLSPTVLRAFAEYMHTHRRQADGTLRPADNWQKGIPFEVYMKSLSRHFMDLWSLHRGVPVTNPETGQPVEMLEALMACLFNIQGYAFELLRAEGAAAFTGITNLGAGDSEDTCPDGDHRVSEPHLASCYAAAAKKAAGAAAPTVALRLPLPPTVPTPATGRA